MHKIKLFKGVETELRELENEVNEFLASDSIRVVNVFGNIAPQTLRPDRTSGGLGGNFSPSDLFLTVVYESD